MGGSQRPHHRTRIVGRLSLLTAALLAFAGCSAGQNQPNNEISTIKEDVEKLRGANGLFRMPEGGDQERGDLYTTALFSENLGSYLPSSQVAVTAVGTTVMEQDTTDLLTLWSALKLLTASGGDMAPEIEAKLARVAVPPKQTEVGAEISALWFWIDVSRMHDWSRTDRNAAAGAVGTRLDDISVTSISDKPYLLWRLYDSYSALQRAKPADLERALRQVDIKSLPHDYESTLDFQAALETKSTLKKDLVVPNDAKAHIVQLIDQGLVNDDALIDSMLRSLQLLGAQEDAHELVRNRVAVRIDKENGLVRAAALENGSVHATYLASRLLDTSFPDIANDRTKQELERVLRTAETDTLTRLKALVALKRSGSEAWHDYAAVVGQAQANIPATVTADNLNQYVELIDVLVQADPSTPLSSLKSFDAQADNESSLSKALIALSNSMYFKNSAEIRSMFPAVQSKLPELIANRGTGLNYFRALTAMTSASLSGLDSNDFDSATQKLQALKGCKEFSSLYRLQTDEATQCSLSLSAALIAVPGAYDLGATK